MTSAPERQMFILLQTAPITRQPLYIPLMTHSVTLSLPSEMQRCVNPIPRAFEHSGLAPKRFSTATHTQKQTARGLYLQPSPMIDHLNYKSGLSNIH